MLPGLSNKNLGRKLCGQCETKHASLVSYSFLAILLWQSAVVFKVFLCQHNAGQCDKGLMLSNGKPSFTHKYISGSVHAWQRRGQVMIDVDRDTHAFVDNMQNAKVKTWNYVKIKLRLESYFAIFYQFIKS